MNKWKKALSVGMSAALMASLFTFAVASTAFAQTTTVTGGGPINPGGPASAAITIHATEDAVGDWADGTDTITLTDAIGASTIKFTGTPTIVASGGPAPFACSAALATSVLANDRLTITCSGTTNTRLDSFTVTGLSVKAIAGAAIGGVIATWAGAFALGTTSTTASGTLNADTAAGAPATFAYTLLAGSADFQNTDTSDFVPSKVTIGGPTPETVTASNEVANTSFDATTGVLHPAGATITQTVLANRLSGLPVVGDTITVTTPGATTVRQGVNNQTAGNVVLDLGKKGFVAKDSTITLSISSAGEQFSGLPTVGIAGTATLSAGVLSFDRKSITYTVTAKSTTDNDIVTFSNIKLDVAGSAIQGSTVDVAVAASPVVSVVGSPVSIAQVGSTLIGVGAVPNVLIGFNDQPTGLITLTETAAGTLSDDVSGTTNIVRVCLDSTDTHFLRAPWAVVTAGDLKLNSGGVAATQVKMTISTDANASCASFLIYSQSTVASTVEIRGGIDAASSAPLASGPNNGPKISVDNDQTPGPVTVSIKQDLGVAADLVDTTSTSTTGSHIIVAMAVLSGSPAVTALSQPVIVRGGLKQPGGNLTIAETQAGQFADGEFIDVCIQPRSLTSQQDVFFVSQNNFGGATQTGQPIVATNNATGLVAHFQEFFNDSVSGGTSIEYSCMEVEIDHAPVSGLGLITISNIAYDVNADAPFGPVLLFATNFFDEDPALAPGADFSQTVSNAVVGNAVAGTAKSRLGVTQTGAFTTGTKVQSVHKYVTFRFDFGVGAAGAKIDIWGATKTGNDWSAFSKVTTRVANASGVVYYYVRQNSPTWKSYRAAWAGGGVFTPSRQARWIP